MYDPATIRATMGSLFSQKLVRCSGVEFNRWAKSNGVSVVASSPTGLMDYKSLGYRFPAALVVGSEKHGLSDQLLEHIERKAGAVSKVIVATNSTFMSP